MSFTYPMPRQTLMDRRGRSRVTYLFARQVPSVPIRSQVPYVFADSLAHQNELLIWRENDDPVYRGDVRPQDSCTFHVGRILGNTNFVAGAEEDQLATSSDEETDRPSTPDNRLGSPFDNFSSPLTPISDTSDNTGPAGHFTKNRAREPSPTATELFGPSRRLTTYSKHDKNRIRAGQAVVQHVKQKSTTTRRRFLGRPPVGTRRSARIRKGMALEGVWSAENLVSMGDALHSFNADFLTPLIDRRGYVMAAVAGPPKDQAERWGHVIKHFDSAMGRLHRDGHFDNFGQQEARVRYGIGFGESGAKPHYIIQHPKNFSHVAYMQASGGFKEMSAYHNHLYEQIAPKLYARQAYQANQLKEQLNLRMPYFDSVFTTCEVSFADVPALSRTNYKATLDGMEALTLGGNFVESGVVFWEDDTVISLRPGGTVLFPSGTKRFSLVAVKPGETMYVFRQYCNAGAVRWLEKGN
ncbi:hypothetical protein C8R43DRAFT_949409 [Mycena crocata]|nr:hypothetical protein C8R43DRAFT_949409 [Mycena crocata]